MFVVVVVVVVVSVVFSEGHLSCTEEELIRRINTHLAFPRVLIGS